MNLTEVKHQIDKCHEMAQKVGFNLFTYEPPHLWDIIGKVSGGFIINNTLSVIYTELRTRYASSLENQSNQVTL